MAVLITGGGLIGSLVAAKLIEQGERPVIYDFAPPMEHLSSVLDLNKVKIARADILDASDLVEVIKKEGIDCIVHTAGFLLSGVAARPYAGIKINIMGTVNVLEAARILGIRRVVFMTTGLVQAAALDVPAGQPLTEDFTMKFLSQRPRSLYAITKITGEFLGLSYNELYGVDFVGLRIGTVFGPWKGVTSGLPGRFVDQFVKNAVAGRAPVIDKTFLTYKGVMEFVYAKDCANAAVLACFRDKSKLLTRIYRISGPKAYTFQEVVTLMEKVFPQFTVPMDEIAKGGTGVLPGASEHVYDTSRVRNELGYMPQYDLEAATRDYADWLRRYYL
jgi:nucleoside-diphosphate-sugar epimerase